jgi:hypothetical protein
MGASNCFACVQGFSYDSPVTQFPVRSGPGTSFSEMPFKAVKGTLNLPVLDVQPDALNTPNDADKTQVYQWFKLQFPDGQVGWLRAHVVTIQGDFTAYGYGNVAAATYAYLLKRVTAQAAPAAAAPAPAASPSTPAASTPGTPAAPTAATAPAASSTPAPAAAPAPSAAPAPAAAPTPVSGADSARPSQTLSGSGAAITAWNNYGGMVQQLAQANGIETATVLAILAIESGGSGFVNGRLKIRFENHIFRNSLYKAGRGAQYDANFGGGLAWNDTHQYKLNGQLYPTHTGSQDSEYAAFQIASGIDPELAAQAISMGAAQVMGFNYRSNGFSSALEMFNAYSRSDAEQVKGMFNYLKYRGLVPAMKQNDFNAVALGYNGSGQVERYGSLMRQAYQSVKPLLDAIGVH